MKFKNCPSIKYSLHNTLPKPLGKFEDLLSIPIYLQDPYSISLNIYRFESKFVLISDYKLIMSIFKGPSLLYTVDAILFI